MIARLEVTRGSLTEYPLAEKVCGGWQNGVMFYPDAEVTKVTPLIFRNETPTDDEREDMIAFLLRDHNFEESPWGRTYTDAEIANALRRSEVPEPSTECPQCHRPDGLHKLGCGERFGSEPQREPSDAQRLWAVISEAQSRFRKYASQESPSYDDEVDALLDISRILSRASEPQDNDSQVEAAAREINLIFYRADTREFGAEDWDRLYREMATAALRAAGEVDR